MGQSTNDVFSTASHVAALRAVERPPAGTAAACRRRHAHTGRTPTRSPSAKNSAATPASCARVSRASSKLALTWPSSPSAALPRGPGLNADPEFATRVVAELRLTTGQMVRRAETRSRRCRTAMPHSSCGCLSHGRGRFAENGKRPARTHPRRARRRVTVRGSACRGRWRTQRRRH
jgi:hypothetical protein